MVDMADLEKLEQEELISRWQKHRMFCLELAVKFGATYTEQAIEMAEEFSKYILIGKQKTSE
jgi:hypothetical protein